MSKKLLSTLIASLFVTAPAFAQTADDPIRVQGTATVGGIYNNQNAADTAKLEEYQDLGNGALSNVGAWGRNSTTWFQGYGENFGRTDQYMFLRGGMYDVFKVGGYLNDMPHNFSSNAITPYNGVGGTTLTATFPQLNPGTWNSFNLGYERRDAGGYFEWQKNSPWYFRVDGNQVKFDGTKVGSAALGTSPGNGYIALPIPIQNSTSNVGVEGGYQTSKATVSLRWDYSKFNNSDQTLSWTSPYSWGVTPAVASNLQDTSYLAPDNTFNKFTITGNYRDLPWHSVISARYSYAKTTSDVNLATSALNSFPTVVANNQTYPDSSNFAGEHINQSFALAWTANPYATFDTRVYYYWTKLANHSSEVAYGDAPTKPLPSGLGCGNYYPPGSTTPTQIVGNCEPDLFAQTKNNAGFDAWWRFAKGQRLGFGYDYQKVDQERVDYNGATYNKLFVEYKNSMFDNWSGRLKYIYLKRDGHSNYSNDPLPAGGSNNNLYLLPYTSAFDMQSMTSNGVKLNLDWTPTQMTSLSFEANWIKQNFNDVTFGRTDNDRQSYYLSGNWGDPNKFLLNAFGSWEEVKYPSNHRYIGTVSGGPTPPSGWCTAANPFCYDPNQTGATASTSYNWSSATQDQTWMIGVGADWPINEKWMLKASYIYVDNNGQATFASTNNFGNPLNIGNWDDTKQQYFNLKAIYALNKNWSFQGGYAYEKYSRDDISSSGFTYLTPSPAVTAASTSTSYLNGYNLNPNGNQNIFYVTATYRFDAPPLPVAQLRVAEPPPAPRVAPPPPPPPPPAPPPPPPAPQVQKITLDSKVLFDFDKAVLKPEGKTAIDSQIVGKLAQVQKLEVVLVTGHTDPIGTEAYNQKLSERRADAVRDYLVGKGVPKDKIETIGMGEKQQVVKCDQKSQKELIACLQPNRRVEVDVKGEAKK